MNRKLRVLFYGLTHEHASGKLATLAALANPLRFADAEMGTVNTYADRSPAASRPATSIR